MHLLLQPNSPKAEECESNQDFSAAEQLYSEGAIFSSIFRNIFSGIAALDHWRLFWHRSKVPVQNKCSGQRMKLSL